MGRIKTLAAVLACGGALLGTGSAHAWYQNGKVLCDADGDKKFSQGDTPLPGIVVHVDSLTSYDKYSVQTDASGKYFVNLVDKPETFKTWLELPPKASVILPGPYYKYSTTYQDYDETVNWLVDHPDCRPKPLKACWMTGGGVKFGKTHAGGPTDTFGGNVFPSCSPEPGDGGQWNHIDHEAGLHFLGTKVYAVACGNLDRCGDGHDGLPDGDDGYDGRDGRPDDGCDGGYEPGSESPVTPYNYIDFKGEGILRGIGGNHLPPVHAHFWARVIDGNEPGTDHGSNAGGDLDRYYLKVWTKNSDKPVLVFQGKKPGWPAAISGGNLQLHVSSCDPVDGIDGHGEALSKDDTTRGLAVAAGTAPPAAAGCSASPSQGFAGAGLIGLALLALVRRRRRSTI